MGIVTEPRESFLMNKMDVAESTLFELNHDLEVMENIRKQVSVAETEILQEIETYRSAISRIEKYREDRKEVERNLDLQYRRKVSQALDTERCLTLEKQRLKKLEELVAINRSLKSRSNEDFSIFEKNIARLIRQITPLKKNVITKSNEIIKILKDPRCPLSIGIATFANRIVSSWLNPFTISYVIVNVTSEFPQAMDIILAEFHKACVYTLPKNIADSESDWDLKDGEAYYQRIESVMRIYGALVQTETGDGDATNVHGIEHGWSWLYRFLGNEEISAYNNRAAATALRGFLETAGFGLHRCCKSKFLKVVNDVREQFLTKKYSSDLRNVITCIKGYLDDQMYLKEPEGITLKHILSTELEEVTIIDYRPNQKRLLIDGYFAK